MKTRIIPTILTDGLTVVKGSNFNNWRTVGNVEAMARLYAKREVDELMFLDVTARSRGTTISLDLIEIFSRVLTIPFTVGGGIDSVQEAIKCFRHGAEKIVLGTAAILNPHLITEIADIFGNQAIVVSVDFENNYNSVIRIESGKQRSEVEATTFVKNLESFGAGEILLQSVSKDGTLSGMDFNRIREVSNISNLPLIASGGASSPLDFLRAIQNGASAVAAGAIFQFTELTPLMVRNFLMENGIQVRRV
jgi:cyclase